MAKIRALKPETWTDEKIVSVTPLARLLFLGAWNYACDNGHLDDSPIQMKMRILPADSVDVRDLLAELLDVGLMVRKDGYLKIPNLPAHQRPNLYFLTLCEHCDSDPDNRWGEGDRKDAKRGAKVAQPLHKSREKTDVDVDGDGDGDKNNPSPATTAPPPREDVTALCTLLADLMEANGCRRPNIGKGWHDAARLLIDRDKRDPAEIDRVLRWSQQDKFWKKNIHSMTTFRDKYDRLRLAADADNPTQATDDFWSIRK